MQPRTLIGLIDSPVAPVAASALRTGAPVDQFFNQLQEVLNLQPADLEQNNLHLLTLPTNPEIVPDGGMPRVQLQIPAPMPTGIPPTQVTENTQSLPLKPVVDPLTRGQLLPPVVRDLPILDQLADRQYRATRIEAAYAAPTSSGERSARSASEAIVQNVQPPISLRAAADSTRDVSGNSIPGQPESGLREITQKSLDPTGYIRLETTQLKSDPRQPNPLKGNRPESAVSIGVRDVATTIATGAPIPQTIDAPQPSQSNVVRNAQRIDLDRGDWILGAGERELNLKEAEAKNQRLAQEVARILQTQQVETTPAVLRSGIEAIRPQKIVQSTANIELNAPSIESYTPLSQLQRANASTQVPQLALATSLESVDWSSTFADKVQQILRGNLKQAEIRLDPPHLGKIEVKVDLTRESTSITFHSEQVVVREAIDNSSMRLREQLANAGFENVEVDVESGNAQKNNRDRGDADKHLPDGQYSLDDSIEETAGGKISDLVNLDKLQSTGDAGSISLYA